MFSDNTPGHSAVQQELAAAKSGMDAKKDIRHNHRDIVRKAAKNKGVFTSDAALEKLVYLAFTRIRKKWTQPVQNWGQTAQQLAILFPDRFRILA